MLFCCCWAFHGVTELKATGASFKKEERSPGLGQQCCVCWLGRCAQVGLIGESEKWGRGGWGVVGVSRRTTGSFVGRGCGFGGTWIIQIVRWLLLAQCTCFRSTEMPCFSGGVFLWELQKASWWEQSFSFSIQWDFCAVRARAWKFPGGIPASSWCVCATLPARGEDCGFHLVFVHLLESWNVILLEACYKWEL